MNAILALIVVATLAPPLLQGLVLKRILPRLSLLFWFCCVALSAIAWFAMMVVSQGHGGLIAAGFRTQTELQNLARAQHLAGTLNATHIVDLPWLPFLLWTIATNVLMSLLPAWALGMASGVRRATLLFLVASIVAAVVSGIVEQIYQIGFDDRPPHWWALNGLSWPERFHVLAARAGVGAVWGATAAIFVILMICRINDTGAKQTRAFVTHRARGLAVVFAAPLLIALLAPFAGYLAGPDGVVNGAPKLRRVLSTAPSRDRSQGETVLAYSHDIAIPVAPTSAIEIVPDGRSAIVRGADHAVVQVDIANGQVIRRLADPLAPLESYAIAWSPDGRYLALRSNGKKVSIPNTYYSRHQIRIRIYALPEMTLAGEFANSEGSCFDVYARNSLIFSNDDNSLWLVCGQFYAPKPDDLMAIRLELPTMRVHDIRRYGPTAESGPIQGLERIGESIWAWQFPAGDKPFRVHELIRDRDVVTVALPTALVGGMTSQSGISQIDERAIQLNFHGTPPGISGETGPASWILRTLTFDTQTGALIGTVDKKDPPIPNSADQPPNSSLSGHGLRIEAFWRADSKTGEIVLRDQASGRERQRITSIAQRPLQLSADGRWLMTRAI
ncbi:hypothetical protein JQ604_21205 [Bradyrhizobium jicamae]|uniref:YncE family protein n=1 Tax=Bradyrhizobium jicamae TaxID=280332 RepID=UPI001BACAC07|nr:hypothetical protein [Bradyrhizobium jicamae]MBR0754713.1 hypothetical protein [Bradyrhizobium jicamae]